MSGASMMLMVSGSGSFGPYPVGGTWAAHSTATLSTGTLTLNPDGTISWSATGGSSPTDQSTGVPGTWSYPVIPGASVRMTVNSGVLSSGTVGSFLALSSARTWSVARGSPGFSIATITLDFSVDGGATIAASLSATMQAGIS